MGQVITREGKLYIVNVDAWYGPESMSELKSEKFSPNNYVATTLWLVDWFEDTNYLQERWYLESVKDNLEAKNDEDRLRFNMVVF